MKCKKSLKESYWYGTYKKSCPKDAVTMIGDLPVCQHHYNKWKKKMDKKEQAKTFKP